MTELIQALAGQLGVSEEQAKGGAGLIFGLAKEKLGAGGFSQIAGAVPGVEQLVSAAPAPGALSGALGGLTSSLGGGAGQLGSLASLAGAFGSLGLDAGMVGKFLPIVLSFVQSKGGAAARSALEQALT